MREMFSYNGCTGLPFNLDLTLEAAKENVTRIQKYLIETHREETDPHDTILLRVECPSEIEGENPAVHWRVCTLNHEKTGIINSALGGEDEPIDLNSAIYTRLRKQSAGDIEWEDKKIYDFPNRTYNANSSSDTFRQLRDQKEYALFQENVARLQELINYRQDNDSETPSGKSNLNPLALVFLNIHNHGIVPYFMIELFSRIDGDSANNSNISASVPRNYEGEPPNEICYSFWSGNCTIGYSNNYVADVDVFEDEADGNEQVDRLYNGMVFQCNGQGTSVLLLIVELHVYARTFIPNSYTSKMTPETRWNTIAVGQGFYIYDKGAVVSFENMRDTLCIETQQLQGGNQLWYRIKLWGRRVCLAVLATLVLLPTLKSSIHLRSFISGQFRYNITKYLNVVVGKMKPYVSGLLETHLTLIFKLILQTKTFAEFFYRLGETEKGSDIILWRGEQILRKIYRYSTYETRFQCRQHGMLDKRDVPFSHVVFRTSLTYTIATAQVLYLSLHTTNFLHLVKKYGMPNLDKYGNNNESDESDESDDESNESDDNDESNDDDESEDGDESEDDDDEDADDDEDEDSDGSKNNVGSERRHQKVNDRRRQKKNDRRRQKKK